MPRFRSLVVTLLVTPHVAELENNLAAASILTEEETSRRLTGASPLPPPPSPPLPPSPPPLPPPLYGHDFHETNGWRYPAAVEYPRGYTRAFAPPNCSASQHSSCLLSVGKQPRAVNLERATLQPPNCSGSAAGCILTPQSQRVVSLQSTAIAGLVDVTSSTGFPGTSTHDFGTVSAGDYDGDGKPA